MSFLIRITVLYVVLACGLIWISGFEWRTALDLLVLAAGLLPEVVRKSPRIYLAVQRLGYRIANTATTWELNCQLRGKVEWSQVEAAVRKLVAEHPNDSAVLTGTGTRFLIRYRRIFTVEVLAHAPENVMAAIADDCGELFGVDVAVFEQQVGFNRSQEMLEDYLLPLVEQFRDALAPRSAVYSLRVRFSGANPFIGMYLQQLRPELIRSYSVDFRLPASAPQDYIHVDQEKMIVVSNDSIEGFRKSALASLTFSSPAK